MNAEKGCRIYSIALMTLLLFALPLALAAEEDPGGELGVGAVSEPPSDSNIVVQFVDDTNKVGASIFGALLGNVPGGDDLVLKILVFILVVLVVYGVLSGSSFFGENKKWIPLALGIIVAIIGVRFMPAGFLTMAAQPSEALVLFLVLIIPFFVAFMIIERMQDNPFARRVLWAILGVIFLILWMYNLGNTKLGAAKLMYPTIVLVCLGLMAFDGIAQRIWGHAREERILARHAGNAETIIEDKIKQLTDALGRAGDEKEKANIQAQIYRQQRNLAAVQTQRAQPASPRQIKPWQVIIALIIIAFIIYVAFNTTWVKDAFDYLRNALS